MCRVLFVFSSRRRHTRYWRDWSSDVCSSDLFEVAKQSLEAVWRSKAKQSLKFFSEEVLLFDNAPYQNEWYDVLQEIGRASCRERGEISVVAVSLKKKK